ncbi:hypothetical protein YQ44_21875 [Janthinobacterium sp. 1_2014MBL_MicDiv]|nr:hypothetical protein YQ44_21875 [Janthinobacterium sp. 1_2014MBL_MicDiv]
MLVGLAIGAVSLNNYFKERALHTLPYGFQKFSLSDPLPACARWKDHMPSTRDPAAYRLYIEARKIWRSKIAWQFTREEATLILTDVKKAADLGDWGARALMAHFYLHGLGALESNHVLDANPEKSVEITRMAAKAMQPWGLYDLGVAYEHGYGGAHYDLDLAWAYYLRAAQLGSPEAQMALAQAYSDAGRLGDEETMLQCAYEQRHGPAAYKLAMRERTHNEYGKAIQIYQQGLKYGSKDCAAALKLLFMRGHWPNPLDEEVKILQKFSIARDTERENRYNAIYDALGINPDLKLSRLDQVLPLPPAKLPPWSGVEDAVEPESYDKPTY